MPPLAQQTTARNSSKVSIWLRSLEVGIGGLGGVEPAAQLDPSSRTKWSPAHLKTAQPSLPQFPESPCWPTPGRTSLSDVFSSLMWFGLVCFGLVW